MESTSPRSITRSDPACVIIEWDDGHKTTYTAVELRTLCPCAACVDELTNVRTLDPASIPADLSQSNLTLVGNYALSVRFSDGHDTGIYTFPMLRSGNPRSR